MKSLVKKAHNQGGNFEVVRSGKYCSLSREHVLLSAQHMLN